MKKLRKTKIVGTIGPASENRLEELFDAGLNVCRINYSHGSWDEQSEKTEKILKISSFGDEFERVELPGKYALTRQDVEENPELENYFAIIKFIKKIEDASKQQKINETLKEVKKIYSIP